MDLQKEREAFEATQNPIVFERIVYIEKANLFTMKDDFRDDLFTVNKCNELNFGWSSWQAAKAKANKQFEDFIDQAIEDSACADERRSLQYLLDEFRDIVMVEVAQEQTIPDGFVLVPKEPTNKMLDAGYESSYDAKGFEIPLIYKAMIEARESANE